MTEGARITGSARRGHRTPSEGSDSPKDHSPRDVHAALCRNGHSTILVPMESYLGDPAVVLAQHLNEGRNASRAEILAVTGLDAASLDMAWLRAGGARLPPPVCGDDPARHGHSGDADRIPHAPAAAVSAGCTRAEASGRIRA